MVIIKRSMVLLSMMNCLFYISKDALKVSVFISYIEGWQQVASGVVQYDGIVAHKKVDKLLVLCSK